MKLKNIGTKVVTVCGVVILPGETANIDGAEGNDVIDFFVKTNRLAAENGGKTAAPKNGKKKETTPTQEPPAAETEPPATEPTAQGDEGDEKKE